MTVSNLALPLGIAIGCLALLGAVGLLLTLQRRRTQGTISTAAREELSRHKRQVWRRRLAVAALAVGCVMMFIIAGIAAWLSFGAQRQYAFANNGGNYDASIGFALLLDAGALGLSLVRFFEALTLRSSSLTRILLFAFVAASAEMNLLHAPLENFGSKLLAVIPPLVYAVLLEMLLHKIEQVVMGRQPRRKGSQERGYSRLLWLPWPIGAPVKMWRAWRAELLSTIGNVRAPGSLRPAAVAPVAAAEPERREPAPVLQQPAGTGEALLPTPTPEPESLPVAAPAQKHSTPQPVPATAAETAVPVEPSPPAPQTVRLPKPTIETAAPAETAPPVAPAVPVELAAAPRSAAGSVEEPEPEAAPGRDSDYFSAFVAYTAQHRGYPNARQLGVYLADAYGITDPATGGPLAEATLRPFLPDFRHRCDAPAQDPADDATVGPGLPDADAGEAYDEGPVAVTSDAINTEHLTDRAAPEEAPVAVPSARVAETGGGESGRWRTDVTTGATSAATRLHVHEKLADENLSPVQRQIVTVAEWLAEAEEAGEMLSGPEVGRRLGVSEKTGQRRLKAAAEHLAEERQREGRAHLRSVRS